MVFHRVNVMFLKDDARVGIWCIHVVWVTDIFDLHRTSEIGVVQLQKASENVEGMEEEGIMIPAWFLHTGCLWVLSYSFHWRGFSPVCVLMCTTRWPFWANCLRHWWHWNGFPLCEYSCVRLHAAGGRLEAENAHWLLQVSWAAGHAGAAWSRTHRLAP